MRLAGVPVVVMAMPGERRDRAHRLAYDLADAMAAPWPPGLGVETWPPEWTAKTTFVGAVGRFDGRPRLRPVVDEGHPQRHLARALEVNGLAVGLADWPRAEEWPPLLVLARGCGGDNWTRWSDGLGARRMARCVESTVRELAPQAPPQPGEA